MFDPPVHSTMRGYLQQRLGFGSLYARRCVGGPEPFFLALVRSGLSPTLRDQGMVTESCGKVMGLMERAAGHAG